MTAQEALRTLTQRFSRAGMEEPAREAAALITGILPISKVQLYADTISIPDASAHNLETLSSRRIAGEPMQYIIGHVAFMGLTISVGKGVLIPRPETELLVAETLRLLNDTPHGPLRILDLCTGSGCIALALARNLPGATVIGIDRSADALMYASRNAEQNGIGNALFVAGDLFDPLPKDHFFDLLVSNPPYIPLADIVSLQREIREHEPVSALNGGTDGLAFYRRIVEAAPGYLKPQGLVVLELGINQASAVAELACMAGFPEVRFKKDYAGIDRIAVLTGR